MLLSKAFFVTKFPLLGKKKKRNSWFSHVWKQILCYLKNEISITWKSYLGHCPSSNGT